MKIICIGRNYVDHAKELNNPVPDEPVVFCKPDTALLKNGAPFFIPDFTEDVHHEVEVVVRISRAGKYIDREFASKYYDQVTLGIDFTARDVQQKAKEKGHPWEKAKAFDGSAPVGVFVPASKFEDLNRLQFSLSKNGETVQSGTTEDMIFDVDELVSHVSRYFTLKVGDLIFTGTPRGVSKVNPGDELEAFLEGESVLRTAVK